jgi:hypothetical protein
MLNYGKKNCDKNISCYLNRGIDTVKITPLKWQLMPRNFQIQYSFFHSNVIMCIATLLFVRGFAVGINIIIRYEPQIAN